MSCIWVTLVTASDILGSVHRCAASLLCDHEEDAHTRKMHVPDKFCAVTAQGGSQGS